MEPSLNAQRTHEISDPAMADIKRWIDSYTSWEKLSERVRLDLARRAALGDDAAIEAMCNHNMRLVLSRAVKRLGNGLPLPDLVQEGWIGLRLAAQKYDPRRGSQFSSVAVWWIDRALRDAIIKQGRAIYLPHHVCEHLARIAMRDYHGEPIRAKDQLWMDNLARELSGNPEMHGVTFSFFDHLRHGPVSIDKQWGDANLIRLSRTTTWQRGDSTLADFIPAPAHPDPSDTLDLEALLLTLVNRGTLSRRDGWLIVRHFGLDGEGGRTLTEMAQELRDAEVRAGVASAEQRPLSRERIRQLISNALTKIRLYVQANGQDVYQQQTSGVYSKEQTKGSQVPQSPAKVKSTESPKRSTRNTSVNDLSQETVASRAATPTPLLRVHDNTKRATGSSRGTRKSSGLDVPYAEAI